MRASVQKNRNANQKETQTRGTKRSSLYADSIQRAYQRSHFVNAAKRRSECSKNFRASIREIYHETDNLISFQQNTSFVVPLEMTPKRAILGRSSYGRRGLSSVASTKLMEENLEIVSGEPAQEEETQVEIHEEEIIEEGQEETREAEEIQEATQEETVNEEVEESHKDELIIEEESVDELPEETQEEEESINEMPEEIITEVHEEEESVDELPEETQEEESDAELPEEAHEEEESVDDMPEEIITEAQKEESAIEVQEETQEEEESVDEIPEEIYEEEGDEDAINEEPIPDVPRTPQKSAFPPRSEMMISPQVSKYAPCEPEKETHGSYLLEISIRPWLYSISEKYNKSITKFRDIPLEEFDSLKSLGFRWVWFMGVWQLGSYGLNFDRSDPTLIDRYNTVCPGWTKEDIIGYPLCIVDYKVNRELGTEEDLAWLRQQLNTRGMRLMLDFVPEHTAIDCPLVAERPDMYVRSETRDPTKFMENGIAYASGKWIPPMYFAAQLDMTNHDARRVQIDNLKVVASQCDGVRVHVAHFALSDLFMTHWKSEIPSERRPEKEFWEEAIAEVRDVSPGFVFIAESYGSDVQQKLIDLGFDYVYDKELLDSLVDSKLNDFKAIINQDVSVIKRFVHFVENHDEPRAITRFYDNVRMANAAAGALMTLPGMRLFNFHQWLGYSKRIDVHMRRSLPDSYNDETLQFYKRLMRVIQTDAMRYGAWEPVSVLDANTVLAWKWVWQSDHILVTVNFSGDVSGGRIICGDAPQAETGIHVYEYIGDVEYVRDGKELAEIGLRLLLDPYQVQVFKY